MSTLTGRRLLFPVYPELTKAAKQAEREATYQAWLCFIDQLEPEPPRNHRLARNYYNADGDLLITLDQFVRAVIDGDLA